MVEHGKQIIKSSQLWWLFLGFISISAGIVALFVHPLIIFAAIILIANVVVIIKYPIWGLLSYLIIFLLRPGELYPALAPMRVELLTGVFVLIVIIIRQKVVDGKVIIPRDRITLGLVAFLAVMYLSIFTSYDKVLTAQTCQGFIKILIFFYLIVSIVDTRRKYIAFMFVFYLLIAYMAFDAFYAYMSGSFIHTMGVDRMQGSTSAGGDPNTLANTLATTIPIVFASVFYFRHWLLKVVLSVLGLAMAAMIAITASRGGMVAFLAVLVAGFFFTRKKAVLVALMIILLPLGWFLLPEQYKMRYQTLTEIEDINETSSGRWEIWGDGLKMIVARPVIGVGAGAFMSALGSGEFGRTRWMQAHNLYIQLMATTGIIGFLVWFGGFIYNFLRKLKRLITETRNSERYRWIMLFGNAFIISLISLFVSGMFGHSLYRYTWYMMAALTIAMESIYRESKIAVIESETANERIEVS